MEVANGFNSVMKYAQTFVCHPQKCTACQKDKKWKKVGGATAGCAVPRCKKTFHFYCAAQDKDTITRRIEITNKNKGSAVVAYRLVDDLVNKCHGHNGRRNCLFQ